MAASDKPHVIRLRGPWQISRHSSPGSTGDASQVEAVNDELRLPACSGEVVPADFRGQLQMRRNFNWPEALAYRESLWLVVAAAAWPELSLELNGAPLGSIQAKGSWPAAWEITELVAAHNELQLTWMLDAPATSANESWVEVQLEVRLDVGPRD